MSSTATAKSQIFDSIRQALQQFSDADRAAAKHRYDEITASLTPRPVVDGALIDQFCHKHTAVQGTFAIVATHAAIPNAVQDFLDEHDLAAEMVMGRTKLLSEIDWPENWHIERRTANKADVVAVTDAICAIAETGSIVIANSPEVSSTHLYLPENHVVIMDTGQLVRHLEDAMQLVSHQVEGHSRGVHLVTGPSKTADVEQTIQYGAHGPRRLHAIFVDTRAV